MKVFEINELNLIVLTVVTFLVVESVLCEEQELEIHNLTDPPQCERKAKVNDVITLNYIGFLGKGRIFDSSYQRNEPFTFQLGIGQVIQGWDRGLVGTCEGQRIKLVIPPNLGYGDTDHGDIPGGSTLTFEIELIKIEEGENPVNVFKEIDLDADGKLSRLEVGVFLKKQLSLSTGETLDQEKITDEVFSHEDKDNDGYISHNEFSGPKHDRAHDEL